MEDKKMKKAIIAGLTLTMALSFATAAMAEEKAQFPQPEFMSELDEMGVVYAGSAEAGTKVEFKTKDLNGNEIDSASLFGKADVTMFNVWQTRCMPCIDELPELQKLADEYADKGCQVVTYCCDTVDDSSIKSASELTSDFNFVTLTYDDSVDKALPTEATPTTYFVNKDGVVLGKAVEAALTEYYGKFLDFYRENSGAEEVKEVAKATEARGLFKVKETAANNDGFRAEKANAGAYEIKVVDQNGNPVEGVMANLCDDSMCNMVKSDDKGVMTFNGKPYAYHITILKVPEGYSFDSKEELHTADQPGTMTITINKD